MFDESSDCDNEGNDPDYLPSDDDFEDNVYTHKLNISTPEKIILNTEKNSVNEIAINSPGKIYGKKVWADFLSNVNSSSVKMSATTNNETLKESSYSSKLESLKCKKSNLDVNMRKYSSVFENEFGCSNKQRSSLKSLLAKINKKSKTTTLQKSIDDWNSFKRKEGIEESLRIYNRGKQGYIERQKFLLRSDIALFERERNMRQARK